MYTRIPHERVTIILIYICTLAFMYTYIYMYTRIPIYLYIYVHTHSSRKSPRKSHDAFTTLRDSFIVTLRITKSP